jgi:hypothetical protein
MCKYAMASKKQTCVHSLMPLAKQHHLRGCDGIQLAAALRVAIVETDLVFVSSNAELNNAARAEGLAVENPNHYA